MINIQRKCHKQPQILRRQNAFVNLAHRRSINLYAPLLISPLFGCISNLQAVLMVNFKKSLKNVDKGCNCVGG